MTAQDFLEHFDDDPTIQTLSPAEFIDLIRDIIDGFNARIEGAEGF